MKKNKKLEEITIEEVKRLGVRLNTEYTHALALDSSPAKIAYLGMYVEKIEIFNKTIATAALYTDHIVKYYIDDEYKLSIRAIKKQPAGFIFPAEER